MAWDVNKTARSSACRTLCVKSASMTRICLVVKKVRAHVRMRVFAREKPSEDDIVIDDEVVRTHNPEVWKGW